MPRKTARTVTRDDCMHGKHRRFRFSFQRRAGDVSFFLNFVLVQHYCRVSRVALYSTVALRQRWH